MGRFYSETKRPTRITQPLTNKYEPEYEERIDTKTGKKYLKETGKINVYEKIQEAKEGCSLKEIMKRYGMDANLSARKVEENTGVILDYTGAPKNLMEALEITNEAKNMFEKSSKEIKKEFNNNFTEFLAAANNGTLKQTLEKYMAKGPEKTPMVEPVIKEEVKIETGVKYE